MAGRVSPKITTTGLVLCLDATNRNSYVSGSDIWLDLSGNENHGYPTSGADFSIIGNESTPPENTFGAAVDSFIFVGASDFIDCGNGPTIQLLGDMSIISWIDATDFQTSNGIAGKTVSGYPAPYDFYLNSVTGIPAFARGKDSTTYATSSAAIAPNVNVWSQVSVTMSGTNVVHYLNGKSNGTGTISTTIENTFNALRIGNRALDNVAFKGNIALVLIYDRALTEGEILQNYNTLKTRFKLT